MKFLKIHVFFIIPLPRVKEEQFNIKILLMKRFFPLEIDFIRLNF